MINYTRIPNELARNKNLSPIAKVTALVIFSYFPKSFPTYKIIIEHSGLSRPSVRKAIKELVDKKFIVYQQGTRNGFANEYAPHPRLIKVVNDVSTQVNVINHTGSLRLPPLVNDVNPIKTNPIKTNTSRDFSLELTNGRLYNAQSLSDHEQDPRNEGGIKLIKELRSKAGV